MATEPIQLDFSDGRPGVTDLAEINGATQQVAWGVWPLDLSQAPADVKKLVSQPTLKAEEAD